MRYFFLAVFFLLFVVLLWYAVPVLLLLFASALIAVALRFVSDKLSGVTGIPPLWSLTLVLVMIVVAIGGAGAFAAPAVWEQIQQFGEALRRAFEQFQELLRETDAGRWLTDQIAEAEGLTENLLRAWTGITAFFGTTFGAIAGFLLILVMSLFLAYDPEPYISGLLRVVPKEKRSRAREILDRLGHTLRWWMVGQLISMALLFVSTWAMLWILGVPLAFMLGLITGLFTFVPYLGPILALVPILLIALAESPTLALWVLALYLVIQNVEANVVMPIVFKKTVHLPPAATLATQVLLGGMLGLIGIILATPLLAAAMVLVQAIYVEDVIGDKADGE